MVGTDAQQPGHVNRLPPQNHEWLLGLWFSGEFSEWHVAAVATMAAMATIATMATVSTMDPVIAVATMTIQTLMVPLVVLKRPLTDLSSGPQTCAGGQRSGPMICPF